MAYTTATLISKSPYLTDGRVPIEVEFTGNAGETPVSQKYILGPSDTALTMRAWASQMAASLNSVKTFAGNLAVGQSISVTPIPPPSDPVPTAKDIWLEKARRYQRVADLGLAGQFATDLAALKADLEATYVTGYF